MAARGRFPVQEMLSCIEKSVVRADRRWRRGGQGKGRKGRRQGTCPSRRDGERNAHRHQRGPCLVVLVPERQTCTQANTKAVEACYKLTARDIKRRRSPEKRTVKML